MSIDPRLTDTLHYLVWYMTYESYDYKNQEWWISKVLFYCLLDSATFLLPNYLHTTCIIVCIIVVVKFDPPSPKNLEYLSSQRAP
jgi:hypothetical protein